MKRRTSLICLGGFWASLSVLMLASIFYRFEHYEFLKYIYAVTVVLSFLFFLSGVVTCMMTAGYLVFKTMYNEKEMAVIRLLVWDECK